MVKGVQTLIILHKITPDGVDPTMTPTQISRAPRGWQVAPKPPQPPSLWVSVKPHGAGWDGASVSLGSKRRSRVRARPGGVGGRAPGRPPDTGGELGRRGSLAAGGAGGGGGSAGAAGATRGGKRRGRPRGWERTAGRAARPSQRGCHERASPLRRRAPAGLVSAARPAVAATAPGARGRANSGSAAR